MALIAGWNADGSVASLVETHMNVVRTLPLILVSSIDSQRPGVSMPWLAKKLQRDPGWARSRSPLILDGTAVVELVEEGLLSGFDELWVLTEPLAEGPPDDASIVAPLRLDAEVPEATAFWVEQSRVRIGVGDGYGLNHVATDIALASALGVAGPSLG